MKRCFIFHTFRGGWVAPSSDANPWIQARFEKPFKIVAVQTQGRNGKYVIQGKYTGPTHFTYHSGYDTNGIIPIWPNKFRNDEDPNFNPFELTRAPEFVERYKISYSMNERDWPMYKNDDGTDKVSLNIIVNCNRHIICIHFRNIYIPKHVVN